MEPESPLYHVPEAMQSVMASYYTIDGNAAHSTEVTFKDSEEAPPGSYDFQNIIQFPGHPISAPGQLSSRNTPLLDMAQPSQQLAALSYGSCSTSEFSGFGPSRHSSMATACYDSRSPEEETDSIPRPLGDHEIQNGLVYSTLSSSSIFHPHADREVRTAFVTRYKEADESDDGNLQCSPQDSDEADGTGLVMEKILRDHFQTTSEPSSYPMKTPSSSSSKNPGNNPSPTFCGIRELQDCSLVSESTRTSTSGIESCGIMSQPEPSPFAQHDQLQSLASMVSSEFTLLGRPSTFKRPLELKNGRKWNQQRHGGRGLHQGPCPSGSNCEVSCKESTSTAAISSTIVTNGRPAMITGRPKRRRTRISRGESSAETQRMTHIAVERNRRKQMNDHLSALKALMPSTFVQKADQASIIGGAVEFVKELEDLLESLLSTQRRRSYAEILGPVWTRLNIDPEPLLCTAPSYPAVAGSAPGPLQVVSSGTATSESDHTSRRMASKRTIMSSELLAVIPESTRVSNELRAECRSTAATVEVKVLGNDAIVNITTHRRAKQLVKVILTLESLDMNIMHISVTTSNSTVLYTFSAKVGPECRMTVNHIAATLHQKFYS